MKCVFPGDDYDENNNPFSLLHSDYRFGFLPIRSTDSNIDTSGADGDTGGCYHGNERIASPALLEFAGPLLMDGGGMYYTAIGAPAGTYLGATEFIEDFQTRYGSAPQTYAAQAYDAAGIWMKAIEEASKAKGGEVPTREEVASSIRALQDYKGITGVYNINKYGDPDLAQYFVIQVISIDPAAWDQNPLVTSFEIAPPE